MAEESLVQGFKNFVLRGNVVDLAVAVVIGTALAAVIKAIVDDLINPLISAILGKPDLSGAAIGHLNGAAFRFGDVVGSLITFLAIAAVVYFLIVRPVNTLLTRFAKKEEVVTAPDPQLQLLAEIRDLLAATE